VRNSRFKIGAGWWVLGAGYWVLGGRCWKICILEYVKFLTYSIASCDETINHLDTIIEIYPDLDGFSDLKTEYEILGRKINSYIQYVEQNWKT